MSPWLGIEPCTLGSWEWDSTNWAIGTCWSLRPIFSTLSVQLHDHFKKTFYCLHQELNPWPSDYENGTLPTELLEHVENWEQCVQTHLYNCMTIARKYFVAFTGNWTLDLWIMNIRLYHWAIGTCWKYVIFTGSYCHQYLCAA